MKLKDDKTCQKRYRPDHIPDDAKPVCKECRFGYCVILHCPVCGLSLGSGWGPVACPHKKNENGTLRWFKYPAMDKKTPAPVKKNAMRKRRVRR